MARERKLDGLDRAAILFATVGPEYAAPILKGLDDVALVALGRRMSELGKIERDVVNEVVDKYLKEHLSEDLKLRADKEHVEKIYRNVMEEDRAERVISELNKPKTLTVWEKLSRLKPEVIKSYLEGEHPQTMAVVLGQIDSSIASRVIALYPEDVQLSIVMRMSKIETVATKLVEDIEKVLEKELSEQEGASGLSFDGMISVVEILKSLNKDVTKPILASLEEKDKELFAQVDRLLLVFDDLEDLDDRDIQTILKHVSTDELLVALKGASDELAETFFSNMSQRAAEMMREDMQVMGPLKLSEVEETQQSILKTVRKLDDDGEITLSKGDML